jgi:hypothetical protein
MSVDLLLKLIDRCIQLLDYRKEQKRELLANHIQPVYDEFCRQHEHYMVCFDNYRKIVREAEPESPGHPVFDVIKKDHVFSQAARAKLGALSKRLSTPEEHNKFDPVNWFVHGIVRYFIWTNADVYEDQALGPHSNDPRSCLLLGLKYIFEASETTTFELASRAQNDRLVWIVNEFSLGYISSDIQFNQLSTELRAANGDLKKSKIALAIGLIDNIVSSMQRQFGYVTEDYLKVRDGLA